MSRFVRSIAALALVAAAQPGVAYVRETTSPGHPESGVCLWWRGRAVTYRINAQSASYTPCGSVTTAEDAAAAGLASWGAATKVGDPAACTDFHFVRGAPTTQKAGGNDGTNLVVFRTKRCSDVIGVDPCNQTPGACAAKFNCWEYEVGTIGFTTTTFDKGTGEIFDADMELFGWDGTPPPTLGHYFTCVDPTAPLCATLGETGCNDVDVTAVVTHEAGHMLGLDHVCSSVFPPPYDACPSPQPVMAPQVGNVVQRGLAPDDVLGVCKIYPVGAGTLTCVNGGTVPEPPSPKGGCSCSSPGESGLAGILLAVAFVALRERRRRR